ncbi:hypothetical protein PsorP6_007125 [Peronosclerospora sorghi]|uniref:Uncharacterized protein n=1 Tax=Peronosclerospora sorghi TaxID=230839 RepID=A0ACC0WAR8_9STRA|nr:hypothetical protein PsorP6_007125 [Peronosclerospora sorghi]
MTNVKHHREDGSQPAKMLSDAKRVARDSPENRVKDNLTRWTCTSSKTEYGYLKRLMTFSCNLSCYPYVRTTLSHDDQGHSSVTFQAPDLCGIFLFRVLYRRLGLSTIFTTTQVSLRPFKHDDYERFIPAAYPYYASAFPMMVGVFLFSVYFLFYDGKQ